MENDAESVDEFSVSFAETIDYHLEKFPERLLASKTSFDHAFISRNSRLTLPEV